MDGAQVKYWYFTMLNEDKLELIQGWGDIWMDWQQFVETGRQVGKISVLQSCQNQIHCVMYKVGWIDFKLRMN